MRIVITGGSGVGKSEVVAELSRRGYIIIGETARFILERIKKPMQDFSEEEKTKLQQQILDLQDERESYFDNSKETIFQDRSQIDAYVFSKFFGIDKLIKFDFEKFSKRYYGFVFILEPLKNFVNDSIRWETENERNQIHSSCIETYNALGYTTVFVPPLSISERANYIISQLELLKPKDI